MEGAVVAGGVTEGVGVAADTGAAVGATGATVGTSGLAVGNPGTMVADDVGAVVVLVCGLVVVGEDGEEVGVAVPVKGG
jgi:hypothetical protein